MHCTLPLSSHILLSGGLSTAFLQESDQTEGGGGHDDAVVGGKLQRGAEQEVGVMMQLCRGSGGV